MLFEIILALLGLILIGTLAVIWVSPPIKGKSICVLGLPQTGKTLFFNALQGKYAKSVDETNVDKIESFRLKDENGKTILKIRDTKDIGGSNNYARQYYDELIKNSDIVIFCCNIYEYLKKDGNARSVKARMQYVYTLLKKYNKAEMEPESNRVRIFLTYADQVDDRKEAIAKFVKSIEGEDFAYFAQNVAAVNMTDKNEVNELIKLTLYGK